MDQQTWDPSVKALTAFPSVLANMDKNLSWALSLGDAYYNQQSDVMDAIQRMRQKAQQAGNLKDTPQQTVQTQGSNIVIQPADPDVVYVPAYDPWAIYGYPIAPWPFWYNYPGIWFGGPYLSFGLGFGIGFYGGYGWGWHNWGANWGGHTVVYNHNTYISHSNTFYNRNNYYHNGGERGVTNNVNRGFADRGGRRNTTTAPTVKTTPIMAETLVNAAQSRIAPESGLSTVIAARREGSGIRAGRAAGPLLQRIQPRRKHPRASPHVGNPVSAAVADSVAAGAAADIIASRFRTLFNASLFGHF